VRELLISLKGCLYLFLKKILKNLKPFSIAYPLLQRLQEAGCISLIRFTTLFLRLLYKLPTMIRLSDYTYSPNEIEIPMFAEGKYVRVDVGLSDDASHSVESLIGNDSRIIIGVEPHPLNLMGLLTGVSKFHSISIAFGLVRKGLIFRRIPNLQKRFILVRGAAGSSPNVKPKRFYSAFPDRGNSSFYPMQSLELTGNRIDKYFDVDEFPLSIILEKVLHAGYPFVESLKIDTEGHELEVLQGAGQFLRYVLFCRVECFRGIYDKSKKVDPRVLPQHYVYGEGGFADSAKGIIDYLANFDFRLISTAPGDYILLNRQLEYLLDSNEVAP
jgi:hypothetical protein